MKIRPKYLAPLAIAIGGCSAASRADDSEQQNDPANDETAETMVEFRMSGATVQDTDRQRAYAVCLLDGNRNFELLALAGPGAILTITIASFDSHRVEPFTELDVSYRPGGDIDPTGAFDSGTSSLCQLRLSQVVGDELQGIFSCETLTDANGNSARLWEGEFACTLGS